MVGFVSGRVMFSPIVMPLKKFYCNGFSFSGQQYAIKVQTYPKYMNHSRF